MSSPKPVRFVRSTDADMEGDENTDTHTVHVAGQDTQLDPPTQEEAQEEAARVGTHLQNITSELREFQEQMQSAMAGVTGEQKDTKYRHVDDATLHPPYTGSASLADDSQPADVPMGQPGGWKAVLHAGGVGGHRGRQLILRLSWQASRAAGRQCFTPPATRGVLGFGGGRRGRRGPCSQEGQA